MQLVSFPGSGSEANMQLHSKVEQNIMALCSIENCD